MSTPRTYPYAYLRGSITPLEQATISVMAGGLHEGSSIVVEIEAHTVEDGVGIVRLNEKLKRLKSHCESLRVPYEVNTEAIKQSVVNLVSRNRPAGSTCIRLLIYRADAVSSSARKGTYDLAIYLLDAPVLDRGHDSLILSPRSEHLTYVPIQQYCPRDVAERGF